jgi:hypothetical protein
MKEWFRRLGSIFTFGNPSSGDLRRRVDRIFVEQTQFEESRAKDLEEHAEMAEEIRSIRNDLDAVMNEARMHERLVK